MVLFVTKDSKMITRMLIFFFFLHSVKHIIVFHFRLLFFQCHQKQMIIKNNQINEKLLPPQPICFVFPQHCSGYSQLWPTRTLHQQFVLHFISIIIFNLVIWSMAIAWVIMAEAPFHVGIETLGEMCLHNLWWYICFFLLVTSAPNNFH